TGLGAGIPAVDHRDTTASQLGLVFEHGAELAPTAFADRLGQRPVTNHVLRCEVFHRDRVEPAYQFGAGLVEEVAAGIPDTGVFACHLHPLAGAVARTLLH